MSYNMMIGYDIYDRFTMEHFLLCQSMILTTSFFCSRHVHTDHTLKFKRNKRGCHVEKIFLFRF
jgi:hypothetical protein